MIIIRTTTLAFLLGAAGSASTQQLYFPPTVGNTWETVAPETLGWCLEDLLPLHDFLSTSNTKAFIVLKDGRIALEWYFGTFTTDSVWYWASAGKSLTAFLVGRAQEEGALEIDAPTSNYLGTGWTNLTQEQEQAITVWHQLTMTSGLDDSNDADCTDPACLQYLAEPGTRWAYHNAPYTLLDGVLTNATGVGLNAYLFTRLTQPTGLTGLYVQVGYNNVFFSRARSMARFGLLMQGGGAWAGTPILNDAAYYQAMITSSQDLNEAYGYLWWLNGQGSFMYPGIQLPFQGPLMTNAPMDVYAALGKNGQIINVSPSTGIVLVRMGDLPGGIFVPNVYNDQIWQYLNAVMCGATDLGQDALQGHLMMYPNPATDRVQLGMEGRPITAVRLTGPDGREHPAQMKGTWLDVSTLAPGLYQVAVRSADDVVREGRLLVQH